MVPGSTAPPSRSVPPVGRADEPQHNAAREWAKRVFGAPSRFDELVTTANERDELLVRIATEVIKRELVEERSPLAPNVPPIILDRIDPAMLQPWNGTLQDMRAETERIVACSSCQGRGGACSACRGRGAEISRWTFREETRIDVVMAPPSMISRAYPRLALKVFLEDGEMAHLREIAHAKAEAPITSGTLPLDEGEIFKQKRPRLDPRTERVSKQEYHRWSYVHRQIEYEMCGKIGTIVQWGSDFEDPYGDSSAGPVRARNRIWGLASLALLVAAAITALTMMIWSAYFRESNLAIALALGVAATGAIGVTGGVLRVIRPRGIGRLRKLDFIFLIVVAAGIGGAVSVKVLTRPRVAQAREAILAGDLTRARVVMTALTAAHAPPEDLVSLEDDIAWSEAQKTSGAARLTAMQALAASPNHHAQEARAEVHSYEIEEVRHLLAVRDPQHTLERISERFGDSMEADVTDLRAAAYDEEYELCENDPCRYDAARRAERAHTNPGRTGRAADVRARMFTELLDVDDSSQPILVRLKRANALDERARVVAAVATDDAELSGRAHEAIERAARVRDQVPFIGAPAEILGALFPDLTKTDSGIPRATFEDMALYFPIDSVDRVTGVYVVGKNDDTRKNGIAGVYKPGIVLSKALARSVDLPVAPGGSPQGMISDVGRKVQGVSVLARWSSGALVEMRVGDASPSPKAGSKADRRKPIRPGTKTGELFVLACPGGAISVDGLYAGDDTAQLKVEPGSHEVAVQNRFLGTEKRTITIDAGATKDMEITW